MIITAVVGENSFTNIYVRKYALFAEVQKLHIFERSAFLTLYNFIN